MFTIRNLRPGALSVLLAAAAPATHAATEDNPWGLQVYAGDSLGMHGDFSTNRLTAVPDLGPLVPDLAGTPGSVALTTITYEDMYRSRYNLGAELSYAAERKRRCLRALRLQRARRRNEHHRSDHLAGPGEVRSDRRSLQ